MKNIFLLVQLILIVLSLNMCREKIIATCILRFGLEGQVRVNCFNDMLELLATATAQVVWELLR